MVVTMLHAMASDCQLELVNHQVMLVSMLE